MKVKKYTGSLYDYTSGSLCGVLVKEGVMKKLCKLQNDHLQSVKRLLTDEAEKGNVFPSMWALHYPEGKQTVVNFIDASADVKQRISAATRRDQPAHKPLVFIASSMEEAKDMADHDLTKEK